MALLGVLIPVASFIALLALGERLPSSFVCHVDDTGVTVLLFNRFRIARVPLEDIADVSIEPWSRLLFDGSLKRSTRLGVKYFSRPVVIWRKDRGPVLVAPPKPETFVADLNKRLADHARRFPSPGMPAQGLDASSQTRQRIPRPLDDG